MVWQDAYTSTTEADVDRQAIAPEAMEAREEAARLRGQVDALRDQQAGLGEPSLGRPSWHLRSATSARRGVLSN